LLNQSLTGWHSGMCRKDKMRGWSNFPIGVRQSENKKMDIFILLI